MPITDWKEQICVCGHSRWDHEDEHSEVPTGSGRCRISGCECDHFEEAEDA